jgi:hypothetical protein
MSIEQTSDISNTSGQLASFATSDALRIRLDVSQLLQDIERDLRGEIIIITQDDSGNVSTKRQKVGKKKANDSGIQVIMKFLKSLVNTAGIQGNLTPEAYETFLCNKHLEFSKRLWVNLYEYEIDYRDFDGIIEDCMSLVELVVSRTINNLERDSYNQTIKHSETATVEQKRGIFPI